MVAAAEAFVGRRREMEALEAALENASEGKGRLVLISGEPGIGKTRTALELNGQALRLGAQTWWGRCHEEAGAPPYWPWVQIIQAVAAKEDVDALRAALDAGAADIAEIVPAVRTRVLDLEPPAALSDPAETRFRLFGSVARFLINLSRLRPLVLVLDDLHWADIPSLRLLEFLAQEISDSRLLIIGTYRETELSRRHQLSHTLGALVRVPYVVRLHLQGLSAEEVHGFVATTAGLPPPPWLTRAISEQTEGNPLFVREIVRFLVQQGHFSPGETTNSIPPAIRLPEGVREVIGRRLNLLSGRCNEILAVGAVIGREFSRDILVRACPDHREETVLDALDEAIGAHVVEETTPGTFQFTHALVRITLYDELRTSQRRLIHHVVGEAIETAHRRDRSAVLPDLAYHFHAAGFGDDVERAIDYATRAGRSADAALAFEDASALFQNALDMVDTLSADDPSRRCELMLLLGDSQRKANNFPEALETLRAGASIARKGRMATVFAEIAYAFADTAWRHDAQANAGSGPMLEEALRELPEGETGLRVKLMGSLARDRLHTGKVEEAKAFARRAIAMARTLGDPAMLATSLAGLVDAPWTPDETEQMLADASEMAEMAERANDLELAVRGHFRRISLILELGDSPAAAAALETMIRVNARVRQPIFTLFELGLKATMALMRGELDEAEQLIIRTTRAQPLNRTHVIDPVSMLIFTLRREQGRLRELSPFVTMFVRQTGSAATWQPGLALLYVELGDLSAARAVFDELSADNFGALPRDGRWATCLIYLAEVCVALGDRSRAAVLYQLLLPWTGRNIVMGGGTGFWGSSGRFLGLLSTIQAHWLDAERHFTEAMAMNRRVGAEAPLAHTFCDYADMLLTRGYPGDHDRAADHLSAAGELAATLGLAAVAARVAILRERYANKPPKLAAPDKLTAREMEVLRLIAIGRGNADIALVLEISLNTAARHVHNILTKTGCANRTEAAVFAARHGLHAG